MTEGRPTAIDLYAGAGGATQGLTEAGFEVLAAVEWDRAASRSYAANHRDVRLYATDIRKVDPRQVMRDLGLQPGQLTLLQACPPCQSVSTLGRKPPRDDRTKLVDDVLRFLEGFRPKAVVLENVPGLTANRRLRRLLLRARQLGYATRTYIVDAAAFGVPQRRRRLIAVAIAGASDDSLPVDVVTALPADFDRAPRTVEDAFTELVKASLENDDLSRSRKPSSVTLERIKAIPPRGTRFDLPEKLRLPCHTALKNRNATASYGRMRLDAPAPTLTTRCTTPACGTFIHPVENRGLTLREAAVLQTFPVAYRFEGTYGEIERQIGNAIPVRMAEGVARVAAAVVAGLLVARRKRRGGGGGGEFRVLKERRSAWVVRRHSLSDAVEDEPVGSLRVGEELSPRLDLNVIPSPE